MEYLVIECPHCSQQILIYINEINCTIFRHGVFKDNHQQINPHETKVQCDKIAEDKLIYGCGKPFRINKIGEEYKPEICDYI